MRRRLLPLLFAFASAPVLAQTVMIWGETEVLGLDKVSRDTVLAQLPIKLGSRVNQKEKELLGWCEGLRRLPLAAVSCTGTVIGNELHYVVEVFESQETNLRLSAPTGAPVAGKLPSELRQLLGRREYRVQEIAAEGAMPAEKVTPSGIVIGEDPELRMYDVQIRDACAGMREHLVAMVLDGQHAERRTAAQLLSWAGRPEASIAQVHHRLLDPDREMRNLIGRFILTFADRVYDSDVAEAVAESLVKQLAIPTLTDRTKALGGLAQLLARHPELHSRLRDSARGPLEKIAHESVLPTIGGEARGLLNELSNVAAQ